MKQTPACIIGIALSLSGGLKADEQPTEVRPDDNGLATIAGPEGGGQLRLAPGRNITAAYLANQPGTPLIVQFNQDATEVTLHGDAEHGGEVVLEYAEESVAYPDGRIIFTALDTEVIGTKAKLETHPGNHRIGFWTNVDDRLVWNWDAGAAGEYEATLTFSSPGGGENKVSVTMGDAEPVVCDLVATPSWYHYTSVPVGRVSIPAAGEISIEVKGTEKKNGAVMNFKALILRPVGE